jgi:hypothetical protein
MYEEGISLFKSASSINTGEEKVTTSSDRPDAY